MTFSPEKAVSKITSSSKSHFGLQHYPKRMKLSQNESFFVDVFIEVLGINVD